MPQNTHEPTAARQSPGARTKRMSITPVPLTKRLDDLIAAKERELAKVPRYKQPLY